MTNATQSVRRGRLRELAAIHHRGRYGDYDDAYTTFEQLYLGHIDDDGVAVGPERDVPRYASIANDETYGMIQLCETIVEAATDQASVPDNGECLNVPAGVVDLDTGEQVKLTRVVLTEDTAAALGGIVAMTHDGDSRDVLDGGEGVNHAGIFCDFDELRAAFPLARFRDWAQSHDVERDGVGYLPDFGF